MGQDKDDTAQQMYALAAIIFAFFAGMALVLWTTN